MAVITANAENIKIHLSSDSEQGGTKSFNVNKGGKLYINVNPGNIKISTWDRNVVTIKVRGLEEEELENVEMELSGNTVIVKYNPEWGWGEDAEFIASMPVQFNVEAKTSGGEVDINSGVTGDVDISTMGGDVSVKNIKGKAKLNTQGGDVKVGNIDGNLSLQTMGGDIKVGDISGEYAKLTTMGGDITVGKVSSGIEAVTYGGDVRISGIGGKAEIETMGGNIELQNVKGKVLMDTKGGNLSVRNATGSIKATTYAGEIYLQGISGSVEAKTMSGNISAEINPAAGTKSQLYTQNGEIELTIPSGAKADIIAEIRAWGNWKYMKDAYEIDSDFQPKENSDDEKDKKIRKVYSINGGGGRIDLKSTNGGINIYDGRKHERQ